MIMIDDCYFNQLIDEAHYHITIANYFIALKHLGFS